jgi:hypothetical protein
MNKELAGNNYKEFNENVISAIESVETKGHLKLIQVLIDVENYKWIDVTDEAVDVAKSNVVWSSHHYAPSKDNWDPNRKYWHDSFMWQGRYFTAGSDNATVYAAWRVARVAQKVHGWNRPWFVTEFAKVVTANSWQAWYTAVTSTMKENQVAAWIFFCYCRDLAHEAGWNLADPATLLQILPVLKQGLGAPNALIVMRRS